MTGRIFPTICLSMFTTPDPLLAEIEAFLEEARMTPTAFGRDALNDPGFVFELRTGRDTRRATAQRARDQMAQYRARGEFGCRRRKAREAA